MTKKVTLILCDKDSSAVNARDLNITDFEHTKAELDAIFAETDQYFRRYYYEVQEDDELTPEEIDLLEKIDLEVDNLR